MKCPPNIYVDSDSMHSQFVHGNTTFVTTDRGVEVEVDRPPYLGVDVALCIRNQPASRSGIKQIRAFLKCLLRDMKTDPTGERLK